MAIDLNVSAARASSPIVIDSIPSPGLTPAPSASETARPVRNPAIAVAQTMPATSAASALAPRQRPVPADAARPDPTDAKLRSAADGLMRAGALDRFLAADRIKDIVRNNPQLAPQAIRELARTIDYLPMDAWDAPIAAIEDIAAAGDIALSGVAYQSLAQPFAMARRTIAEGNVAMQKQAIAIEWTLGSRMPGVTDQVADDLCALLTNTDPYANEMTKQALDYLALLANGNPKIANRVYQPIKDRLDALLAKQTTAPSPYDDDNDRPTLETLIRDTVTAYSDVAADANAGRAVEALDMLARVRNQLPHGRALRAMCSIGRRQPELAGRVMYEIPRFDPKGDVAPDCLISLAKAHTSLAADVAHYFRDELRKPANADGAATHLANLYSTQPAAGQYIMADMNDLLTTEHAARAIKVLAQLAWQSEQTGEILRQFEVMAKNASPAFADADVDESLVRLAEARPEQRKAVVAILRAQLQTLAQGDVMQHSNEFAKIAGLIKRADGR
jgi:hypothetical protein